MIPTHAVIGLKLSRSTTSVNMNFAKTLPLLRKTFERKPKAWADEQEQEEQSKQLAAKRKAEKQTLRETIDDQSKSRGEDCTLTRSSKTSMGYGVYYPKPWRELG